VNASASGPIPTSRYWLQPVVRPAPVSAASAKNTRAATLIGIMPTNHKLKAIPTSDAGPKSRALLMLWGKLHAIRTLLGVAATMAPPTCRFVGRPYHTSPDPWEGESTWKFYGLASGAHQGSNLGPAD
jgi:Anthrone oxygenase